MHGCLLTPLLRKQGFACSKQRLLLQALLSPSAQCKRDGEWKEIEARELVPGDLIQLKGGDVIPADAKVKACPSWTSKDQSHAMCVLQSAPHADEHCPNTNVLSCCLLVMLSVGGLQLIQAAVHPPFASHVQSGAYSVSVLRRGELG